MSVVPLFPGEIPPSLGEPNEGLVQALEDALEMARSGRLQSLWATGFTSDGCRFAMSIPGGTQDVYQVLGSIQWLGQEYFTNVTSRRAAEVV